MKIKIKISILVILLISFHSLDLSAQTFKKPKNVIIMIADGTGFNQFLATNYYQFGIADAQKYDKFPIKFAVSTYPAKLGSYPDKLVWSKEYDPNLAWSSYEYLKETYTESAAAATAMATGVKTYNNSIGMALDLKPLKNLTQYAKELGKSAGVITSVPFSHATPAGFVAHNVTRSNYGEIAQEMILDSKCDVIIGAGNPYFNDDCKPTQNSKSFELIGDSLFWNQLLQKGTTKFNISNKIKIVQDCDLDGKPDPWVLIQDKKDFVQLMKGKTPKRVLGVPKVHSTLQQGRSGDLKADPYVVPFNIDVPTLSEMALGAINVLDNNKKGFFLMIEGGATDWAHHENQTGRMIEEITDFNKTVDTVINWVETYSNWNETLLIVTADHETGLLWGPESDKNDKKFDPIVNNGIEKVPGLKWNTNNHSNSLVPFFAKGAGSEIYKIFADETDPVRGKFLNNTEIPQGIIILWNK